MYSLFRTAEVLIWYSKETYNITWSIKESNEGIRDKASHTEMRNMNLTIGDHEASRQIYNAWSD